MRPSTDALAEARLWLLRLREGASAAEQTAFEAWLSRDGNSVAYAQTEALWDSTSGVGQRLAEREAAVLGEMLRRMDEAPKVSRARRGFGAAALVFLLGLAAGWVWIDRPGLLTDLAADEVTARGERREITLPDSSRLTLDADTAIDEEFGPDTRRIRLLRGGAVFDVAHSDIPFVVEAAGGEVRVLGTLFDLHLTDDGAQVVLERGSVEVEMPEQTPTRLDPGHQLLFGSDQPGLVEPADPDALAWRDGEYSFRQRPLAEVLDRIGMYRPGRIVLLSPELGEMRVTGMLSLNNPTAALRSLSESLGFSIYGLDSRLTVIRR